MLGQIIIFGASGFIGSHLLERLSSERRYDLIAADIREPTRKIDGVTYLYADVRDLSSFQIDGDVCLIINLAAVHKTPGHPTQAYYETNILGAIEVTRLAQRNGIKDIIFTSSISVYGPSEEAKTESSPLAPTSAYGWSKMMAEKIHMAWAEQDDTRKLVICRPAVVFGRGEGGNFARLARLLKKGFFVYPGRKDTIKGCFYVKDLMDALLFAWKQPVRVALFNGCYPTAYTIEEIVETFRKVGLTNIRTIKVPKIFLLVAARLLQPFSMAGLNIHPDRIMKLVRSTHIIPSWLIAHHQEKPDALQAAITDWQKETNGEFT